MPRLPVGAVQRMQTGQEGTKAGRRCRIAAQPFSSGAEAEGVLAGFRPSRQSSMRRQVSEDSVMCSPAVPRFVK